VTTRVRHLQPEALVDLLAGLDAVVEVAPVLDLAASAFVEGQLRVDEVAVVLDQPVHAVGGARLLVRGQGDDDVAVGTIAFLPQADEGGDPDRGHGLVVARAAAVEEAVLLEEGEGIAGPVLAPSLHHVEMGEEEQRTPLPRAAQAGHEVSLAGLRRQHLYVGGGESGRAQPGGHGLRRARVVAGGVDGVDLDELLVDGEQRLVGRTGRRRSR
jgi:hypothetical protein